MDRSAALRAWVILFVGLFFVILGARGKFGSGLGALLTPTNMTETKG